MSGQGVILPPERARLTAAGFRFNVGEAALLYNHSLGNWLVSLWQLANRTADRFPAGFGFRQPLIAKS